MKKFYSIEDIRRHNENHGKHFFEKGAMRFFASRVCSTVHPGGVFVTSERESKKAPRLYTVRQIQPDGSITTLSDFQQFDTYREAHTFARQYTQDNGLVW